MKQAMNFKCNSPKMVCDLLKKYVGNGPAQDDIVALDIRAGNGMVGEHLSAMGAETIVGGGYSFRSRRRPGTRPARSL